jgi:hypothetical protein
MSSWAGAVGLVAAAAMGCAPTVRSHEYVSAQGSPPAAPLVVMRPRVCAEPYFGRQGVPPVRREALATVALHDAVSRRLPALGPVAPSASSCIQIANIGDGDESQLRASSEVLAEMRARGGKSVLVTEIVAAVTCNRNPRWTSAARGASFGGGRPHCYEDDVRVTAFLFDADGRLVWASRRSVEYAEDANAAIDEVFRRLPPRVAVTCRERDGVADCS